MSAMDLQTGSALGVGFGCSALLGRSGRRESLQALEVAWDEGIRVFDVARAYGYGEAESLLGEFLQGKKGEAVVATKFGIVPSRNAPWKQAAKVMARKVAGVLPGSRKLLQKAAKTQFVAGQFSVEILQQSIETSLKKLRVEAVDILFLHDAPAEVLEDAALLAELADLEKAGKIRRSGISSQPEVIAKLLKAPREPLRAMQFPCNVFDLSASRLELLSGEKPFLMANHPFGGVARASECRRRIQRLASSPELDKELREKLSPIDDALMAEVVLNVIGKGTGIDVVIPAMMHPAHIRANVAAVRKCRFTDAEIQKLREALSVESTK